MLLYDFRPNVVRIGLSETKRLELGHNAPTTPAMAANITDHPWNFYELFVL
jgi:hypothetical protein